MHENKRPQTKEIENNVHSFLLFVSSDPRYQVEFNNWNGALYCVCITRITEEVVFSANQIQVDAIFPALFNGSEF